MRPWLDVDSPVLVVGHRLFPRLFVVSTRDSTPVGPRSDGRRAPPPKHDVTRRHARGVVDRGRVGGRFVPVTSLSGRDCSDSVRDGCRSGPVGEVVSVTETHTVSPLVENKGST